MRWKWKWNESEREKPFTRAWHDPDKPGAGAENSAPKYAGPEPEPGPCHALPFTKAILYSSGAGRTYLTFAG